MIIENIFRHLSMILIVIYEFYKIYKYKGFFDGFQLKTFIFVEKHDIILHN